MKRSTHLFAKFLYALLFLVIIPVGFWFWAKFTESIIRYPAIESKTAGLIITIVGVLLILWAMIALMKHGKGLPMNAFPPSQFVKKGPYQLFQHPIYWGFGILMVGVFVLTGSSSGLWLVTPLTILSMIALVWGYEKIDLKKRFPKETIKTVLHLPENSSGPTSLRDSIASVIVIAIMLTLGNYLIIKLSGNISPFTGNTLIIHPVFGNPQLQILSLIFIIIIPFLLKKKDILFEWAVSVILGLTLSVFIALISPAIGTQYFLYENSITDKGSGLALSIIAVPIFLILISLKAILRQSTKLFVYTSLIAILLGAIQLTNSSSSILHLVTSLLIFLLAANYNRIWYFLKNTSEKIANSWQEWVIGKVRIINHGFYIGIGVFFAILLAGILSGKIYAWAILVFAFIGIVFSGLWAQIVEGSEKLKRPFGYYGSLVGIPFGCLAVWAMGVNVWVIIGVASVVMPWVQAIGRFRCLVNGCCHGGPVDNPRIGIRYFHFRSRVSRISGMKGELLHPTQLYAILWLFIVGFILLALWNNRFPASFISGIYLILTGIGRFVEEAYRGEVQTKILKGLRLYQWIAIISLVIGIIMTTIPTEQIVIISGFGWETLAAAVLGGLFAFFAMGVDFPYSNKRFSRLV
ncbi:MAG: prolipoprotein diacylglyceryl transferase [Bacteroidales bacterium]|nr:prolipoprotein diacylglyceryl transferase [Bacteroidales bacterium]